MPSEPSAATPTITPTVRPVPQVVGLAKGFSACEVTIPAAPAGFSGGHGLVAATATKTRGSRANPRAGTTTVRPIGRKPGASTSRAMLPAGTRSGAFNGKVATCTPSTFTVPSLVSPDSSSDPRCPWMSFKAWSRCFLLRPIQLSSVWVSASVRWLSASIQRPSACSASAIWANARELLDSSYAWRNSFSASSS